MGFWFTLIMFAVTLLLSELLKPKIGSENQRPKGLGDFGFPTATEGRPVPIFWGTVKISGPNVIWYGDLRQEAITETIKSSLFSSQKVITGYRYYLGVQMAISRGTVDEILRIFVDDEVLWDAGISSDGVIAINEPDFFGGEDNGAGGIVGDVSVRMGSLLQSVPTYLTAFQDIGGQTPAYLGTAYILLENVLLGTSTTIKPWAFEARRIPNGLGLGTPSVNSGNDANPMNVIYEILTDTEWGLGLPSADIDFTKFTAAASTLLSEGNGFSMMLDSQREAEDLLQEIQRQIDGVVFLNRSTGKWDINLARDDYDIDLVPQATPANIVEISEFTRGSWAETQNIVLGQFFSRARDYQETYAVAQDMANIRIQGGQVVKSETNFPGVKEGALANQLVWRGLRVNSFPLARVKMTVDRTFASVNPGEVIAWTDPSLGFTKLPLRVGRVDLGQIDEGLVTLDLVQDVFTAVVPSFSDPGTGDWVALADTMLDIPLADRQVFEAPKAFTDRDPASPGVIDRLWLGLRAQGDGAVTVKIVDVPGQVRVGSLAQFLVAGELTATLDPAHSTSGTLTVVGDPDSKANLLNAVENASTSDVGVSLANIIKIGDEFIGFTTAIDGGGNDVTLQGLIRGMLDSAPPPGGHASGTRVWFLSTGGNTTESVFAPTSTASVRPLPESTKDALLYASATTSSVVMAHRGRRPYPPINPRANGGAAYGGDHSLDTASAVSDGTADNAKGIAYTFTRRDFRQSDEYLKVLSEASLPAGFPVDNDTEYRVEVRDDPSGSDTLLFQTDWDAAADPGISRNKVLAATDGVIPNDLRAIVEARHTFDGVVYESTQTLSADFDVSSSELTGLTNLGALSTSETSPILVAPTTGTYNVDISDALPLGDVEVRINGGSWTSIITGAATTGSFAATAVDDLEFRHTATASPDEYRFLSIDPPSAGTDAYAILVL